MANAPSTHAAADIPIDMDADYAADLVIAAPPEAVFDALTALPGLARWWTTVSGDGLAGGELRFVFGGDEPCVMQVTAAERPSSVRWTCLGYRPLPDWAGTRLSFDVLPHQEGGSELKFRHTGLTPRLECYRDCKNGWDHFLPSLRDFVETGHGSPYGSPTDVNRRADGQLRNAASQAPA